MFAYLYHSFQTCSAYERFCPYRLDAKSNLIQCSANMCITLQKVNYIIAINDIIFNQTLSSLHVHMRSGPLDPNVDGSGSKTLISSAIKDGGLASVGVSS